MTTVVLGNRNAVHSLDHGETFEAMPRGKRATVIRIPEERNLMDGLRAILDEGEGIWARHAKAGAVPAWVASDSPAMSGALAEHFGAIESRKLLDPYDPKTGYMSGPGLLGSLAAPVLIVPATALLLGVALLRAMPWLKTNGGQDFQAAQMAGSASATAVSKWMAITANATAESATDTTLTAEIATAGGGLIRQVGAFAHTTGAASYTITGTFTANGSDALPVTVAKMATFTAAAAGTMTFEKLLGTTATLSLSGDSLVVTQTVSM